MSFGGFVRRLVNTASGGLLSPITGGSSSYKENLRDFYSGNYGDSDRRPENYEENMANAQYAAEARRLEAARAGRVEEGKTAIDKSFGDFNDDFYKNYQNDYTGYYYPQLDDNYNDARKRLTLNLARSGNLTGSVGADQLGKLTSHYNTQKTGITNRAFNASNDLRGKIDVSKNQLYSDNRNAADPGSATSSAIAAASSLRPGVPDSPLANTFSDIISNIGNVASVRNTNKGSSNYGVQNYTSPSNNGSVTYYN